MFSVQLKKSSARLCSMLQHDSRSVVWIRSLHGQFVRTFHSVHSCSFCWTVCWITHMLLDTIALDSALMLCLNCVIVFVIILFGLLVLFMLFKECKIYIVMKSFILTTVLKMWKGNSHTYSWIMWRGTLDMYVLIVRSNIKHIHHIRDIEHLSPCN